MTYTYIRHIPSPPLDTYIDYLYYYYSDGLIYPREKMLPMTTLHLVINLGSTIQVLDASGSKPFAQVAESAIIGTWSACHIAEWPSNVQFFDIRFKPGGAYPFLQLHLSTLHNQFVPLDGIWGPSAAFMLSRAVHIVSVVAATALMFVSSSNNFFRFRDRLSAASTSDPG